MPTDVHDAGREEPNGREQLKALRRAKIRQIAQRLFSDHGFDAVTINDIAAAANVSVQTVFNHFASKDDLFFDGRATWFDDAAEAVRSRGVGVPPLTALREHLVDAVGDAVRAEATPRGRNYTETIRSAASLTVRERELIHEAEQRLAEALVDAWTTDCAHDPRRPPVPAASAALVAATWMAAARVLVAEQRQVAGDGPARARRTADRADQMLRGLALWLSAQPQ